MRHPSTTQSSVVTPLSFSILTVLLAGCLNATPGDPTPVALQDSALSSAVGSDDASAQMAQPVFVEAEKYADGTFAADGAYRSPAGMEQVHVSVTLDGGNIVDASFEGKAVNPRSLLFQGKYAAGFTQYVVGKPIDELALTVVNGSSLTPVGFMDALAKIKAEAAI